MTPKNRPLAHLLPFGALLLCLGITLVFWRIADRTVEAKAEAKFDHEVGEIVRLFRQRLDLYMDVLHGAAGFLAASREVRNDEWRTFAKEIQLTDRYPGVLALRYVHRVRPYQAFDFADEIMQDPAFRKLGYPDLAFRPRGLTHDAYVVTYIEPLAGNQWMFGVDLTLDEALAHLFQKAARTGKPAASGILNVRQGWKLPSSGILVAIPVYRPGADRSTEDGRLKHLAGFADIVLKADEILTNARKEGAEAAQVEYEIYDGVSSDPNHLLYRSAQTAAPHKPRFVASVPLSVGDRTWTVYFSSKPGFALDPLQETYPTLVLYAGFAASLLLFGLLYSFSLSRYRAELLADRMTQEMKRALQVKTEFTSTVSHELRTPLLAIKEGVEMLEDGTLGPMNADQKDMLMTVARNVERLSRLIDSVLDYQKLDLRQAPLNASMTYINELVREAVKIFGPYAAKKDIRLRAQTEPLLDERPVLIDADKITQVLMNLLDNALKFSDAGEILIRVVLIEDRIRVLVADKGVGIDPEDLKKLFREFSQLRPSGTRKTGGTGLGLAISKKIIEAHGGKIGVESVPGRGSTFFFELPLGPVAREAVRS